MALQQAITSVAFLNTIGVNTHIDFQNYGYQNLTVTAQAINYLGLKNLRDDAENPADVGPTGWWQQIANATGAKFDAFMAEGSPAQDQSDLVRAQQLAAQGILNAIEGGNENDDPYAIQNGNSLAWTAGFQQQVWQVGHALGLPVINMSFGAGWTWVNNWQGDYGSVGDLSAYTTYANAHTYPVAGATTLDSMQSLNGLANLAAASRPVVTSEIGWDGSFSQAAVARYAVQATFDGIKLGDVKTYFYALFDDGSGQFGLMNQDGTAKPAGTALHNLTTLLADPGGSFTAPGLNYTLAGTVAADNSFLIQKSDGTSWIALWDEAAATHNVTLNLANAASALKLFDPVTGASAIQSGSGSTFTVSVGADPLLIEVVGETVPVPVPTSTLAGGTIISGAHITDAWAATNPGLLALNVTAASGSVFMHDATGAALAGSGTAAIHVQGTLATLNADLGTLSSTAGTVTIDVWNQAGIETTSTVAVGNSLATTQTVTIAASDPSPVINLSTAAINATAGDHMIFIGGSHDVLTATGGTETVMAFQGANTLTTGAGNDYLRFAGSGNVLNAGAGNNRLDDSGSNNTIVLSSQGTDTIYGYVMQNGDLFDLRSALSGAGWNGAMSTIGNFLGVQSNGYNSVVSVGGSAVATLMGSGPVDLGTLMAHSLLN